MDSKAIPFRAESSSPFFFSSIGGEMDSKAIPLVRAAAQLSISYPMCLNWILRGKLKGWQDNRRHWFADSDDLNRVKEITQQRTGG